MALLLEKVKEAVEEYKDLISGAEYEFEQLNKELGSLKEFLADAAKKTKNEHLFREMERQIRDVIYDVEDTIDICLTKHIQVKARNSRRPALPNSKHFSLPEPEEAIKSIREEKVLPLIDHVKLNFESVKIAGGSGAAEDLQTNLRSVSAFYSF